VSSAGSFLLAVCAVLGRFADGGLGSESGGFPDEGFGKVDGIASFVVDGADVVLGFALLSLLDDRGGDLEAVEHESSALHVHGVETKQAHDLSNAE